MVGARVLPGDDDEIGAFDVLDGDRALADADRLHQGGAGGLVAHVGTVGQVVGAEAAHHQLVEERRLVAGAPGGVEHRRVRVGQVPQMIGDQPVGVVPADLPVVGGARAQHHRVGQPPLLGQPVFGAGRQVGHAVPGEELRGDHPAGGLLCYGLGAVLAELRQLPSARGLRPCAPRAVEPRALVDARPRAKRPHKTHLCQAAPHRHQHGGYPGGRRSRRGDLDGVLVAIGPVVAIGLTARHEPNLFRPRPIRRR